jgi:hypothetical protein
MVFCCALSTSQLHGQLNSRESGGVVPPSQVYYLSSPEFDIPFDVSANGRQPKEVQLEFSVDGGAQWQFFSRQPISRDKRSKRAFTFVAKSDGTYLFRLTTMDEAGNPFPSNDQPMAIVVDSKQPVGEMEINLDAEGRLVATFAAMDANLKAESLRLEYLPENTQVWIPVEIQLTENQPTQARGQAVWDIAPNIRRIVVRLVGADQAGNPFEIIRSPEVPRTATNLNGMQLASQRQNGFTPSSTAQQRVAQFPKSSPKPIFNQFVTSAQPPTSQSTGAAGQSQLQLFPSIGEAQNQSNSTAPVQASQPSNGGGYVLQQLPTVPQGRPASTQAPMVIDDRQFDGVKPNSLRVDNPPSDTSAIRADDSLAANPGVEPYYSDSKTFSLDYALDEETISAVSAVELWGTVDGGKTWEHWDNDPDRASPFDIQVEEEGVFGFRMVIVNSNGLSGSPPRSGEEPDVWVNVDTQLPAARIISALYGKGQEAGSLVIEFACQDNLFGDRPISLYFSENPQGPWTTIAAGLPNTGRYKWRADPNMPRKIYLKIEAVDRAGNVGAHVGDIPVDVQGLAPRGRFQGFRPINSGR